MSGKKNGSDEGVFPERLGYPADGVVDRLHSGHDWLPPSTITLDQYLDLRGYEVHVHYGVRWLDGHFGEYCALTRAAVGEGPDFLPVEVPIPPDDADIGGLKHSEAGDQQPVFICLVEFVEKRKGVIVRPRSVERLQPLKNCRCLSAHPLYSLRFSNLGEFPAGDTKPSLALSENREVGGLGAVRLDAAMPTNDERVKQMVERTTEVVQAIAHDEAPMGHGHRPTEIQPEGVHPVFRITFLEDGVRTRVISELVNGEIQFLKVTVCVKELRPE